jgi:gamma-glutamylcyclotransferase (GGCT)/AIG2-like uncharacterized protein YtfP
MKILRKIRKVYYFGYGTGEEIEMIAAVTGRRPKAVGTAILDDYKLSIQGINEVPTSGENPQQILINAYGKTFKSYVVVPEKNNVVVGMLYRLSLHERHLIDKWELVELGWYKKTFVSVKLKSGKRYLAETQILGDGQTAHIVAPKYGYKPWLVSKRLLMSRAKHAKKFTLRLRH